MQEVSARAKGFTALFLQAAQFSSWMAWDRAKLSVTTKSEISLLRNGVCGSELLAAPLASMIEVWTLMLMSMLAMQSLQRDRSHPSKRKRNSSKRKRIILQVMMKPIGQIRSASGRTYYYNECDNESLVSQSQGVTHRS